MDKANQESFFCFNCGAKNYFDKGKYTTDNKEDNLQEDAPEAGFKEVSIECKSCREINIVRIELI